LKWVGTLDYPDRRRFAIRTMLRGLRPTESGAQNQHRDRQSLKQITVHGISLVFFENAATRAASRCSSEKVGV
jgi:hypothetical protein